MWRLKNKLSFIGIIVFLLGTQTVYTQNTEKDIEDVYLEIRAERLNDDFYMIKYDNSKNEAYIGLKSFFFFLQLFSLDVNTQNYTVSGMINGKDISTRFTQDEAFVDENDELYVKSKALIEKMDFEYLTLDMETLVLDVNPNFVLPYEEKEQGRVERLRLEERKVLEGEQFDLEMKRKLISPGILKLKYDLNDVKNSDDYNFSYEYGSQLLYGELYVSGDIKPESELNEINLKYTDIIEDNDLTIGYLDTTFPSFASLESDLIGISLDNYDTYSQTENGITVIRGEADDADSIELYRNGMLVDYLTSPPRNFEFRLADGSTNARYLLKIYYKNGGIEERYVYSLNDMDALAKGKWKPVIQIGKTKEKGDFQALVKSYYGVTDKFTLGAGYLNLINSDGRNLKMIENDFIYNTRHLNYPTLINFTNYYEVDKNEESYNLSISQNINDYELKFTEEKYSPFVVGEEGTKKYDSLSLYKPFEYNSYEIGVSKTTELMRSFNTNESIENTTKDIYGAFYTSYFNPWSFSFRVTRTLSGDYKYITYEPSISYSGWALIVLDAEITKYDDYSKYFESYGLRADKRRVEILKDRLYMDLGLEAKFVKGVTSGNKDSFVYGITFSMDLEDYINIDVNSDIEVADNGKSTSTTGLTVTKAINLATPLAKMDNDVSVNNYTIQGKVFLDRNGNGVYDKKIDVPLEGVGVLINNQEFLTDKYGNYLGDNSIIDEIITLDVNRKTIDPMYKNSKGAIRIKARNSNSLKVDIPIEVVSMLTGNIWNTEDFTEREFTQNIVMSSIQLEKDGKVYKEIDPEFDGLFFFDDIPPGKYNMKFIYLGQENVKFSPENIEVNVKLQDPDEGEYFEGLDTKMVREEEVENTEDINNY